ncbi:hypothetical protein HanIR_Chr05g0244641 [Helianthus annuus]|nr:hypothetical protein HanIR_Chr05g0244641 [Helianthus annuus]
MEGFVGSPLEMLNRYLAFIFNVKHPTVHHNVGHIALMLGIKYRLLWACLLLVIRTGFANPTRPETETGSIQTSLESKPAVWHQFPFSMPKTKPF